MRTTFLLLAVLPAFATFAAPLSFAPPGSLDSTFNPGAGAGNTILCMALQTDGKIIVGGAFTSFDGSPCTHLARLTTDGRVDDAFEPVRPDDDVQALSLDGDGRILIAGKFASVNGLALNHIARLRTDGSVDNSFSPGSGPNSPWINSVIAQQDGKILVGGAFTSFNGTNRSCVARLNSNGSVDPTFDPSTNVYGYVFALGVQSSAKVVLGLWFHYTTGAPASNHLARLDPPGTVDTAFDPEVAGDWSYPQNPIVRSIAILPDDKIVIGGRFTSVKGYARQGVARLNADGSVDTTFHPGLGANGEVYAVAAQADGKVLLAGDFTSIDGAPRNRIARLEADGGLDTGFNPGTAANSIVSSVAVQPDGKTLIGGYFTGVNGTNINRIARLNGDITLPADTSLLGLRMYPGLTVFGTVSNTYRIEYAADLNTPRLWTPLTNLVLPTSPYLFIDTERPGPPARFYRAISLP